MVKINRKKLIKNTTDYLIIFAGAIIYSLSVAVFTADNNIAPGGVTGLATMLNYLFALPIGMFVIVMNIPLFIWGIKENGTAFFAKTLFATAAESVLIDLLRSVLPSYGGETILAAIFGGALGGAGLGIIFSRGGSTGGTDIIALIMHKKLPHISTGRIILLADIVTLTAAYFVYGSLESALYAGIAIFVSIRVIDAISYGTSRGSGKLVFIVTDCFESVSETILRKIGRGATVLDGEGAYSGNKKRVLMCAVRPQQVFILTKEVKKIDSSAFVIVAPANSIQGFGFADPVN